MIIILKKSAANQIWQKVLAWANRFERCCCLENNGYGKTRGFTKVIAAGVQHEIVLNAHEINNRAGEEPNAFVQLQAWHDAHKDWSFGYLSYDLKNELEELKSENLDNINVPLLHFFQPLYQFDFEDCSDFEHCKLTITTRGEVLAETVWQEIMDFDYKFEENLILADKKIILTPRISKADYLQTIYKIKEDIVKGDYYEINYCQELFATQKIEPLASFLKLNKITQSPFACYYRYGNKYLMGASPERFLRKQGKNLTSNPIKGTAARGKNAEDDEQIKTALQKSEKDRAENVMIVDLVRNDFARCCAVGSVAVPELCAIYTYPQVHQMISTVTGQLRENQSFSAALQSTFPMGSMTGAPKIMAMQRIETYEKTRRGWYSGAVGYITPDGDFDFNVVIRSIFYNAETDYLSTQVGGAIVYDSTAESEYAECLLKAKGVLAALNAEIGLPVGLFIG